MKNYRPKPGGKPARMSHEEFSKFVDGCGGDATCQYLKKGVCKYPCSLPSPSLEEYPVQVDRIVPGARGGEYIATNCQYLCSVENARKGARPDKHWEGINQPIWFDLKPNLENLRPGQRQFGWDPFGMPGVAESLLEKSNAIYSTIHLLWWIVGSGKTLAIPLVCASYNHYIRLLDKAPYRVDNLLILCKETALRDQIARELSHETVALGIWSKAPKVVIVENINQWNSASDPIYKCDIAVACVQQLWGAYEEEADANIIKRLSHFTAIGFDEVHFGPGQIERIKNCSPRALKIATTNTPINKLGHALKFFTQYSMLDYQYAYLNDRSLKKLLDFDSGVREGFYRPYKTKAHRKKRGLSESDLIEGEGFRSTSACKARNMAVELVERLKVQEDKARIESEEYLKKTVENYEEGKAKWFSPHAIIVCEDVEEALRVTNEINSFLNASREKYKLEDGWRAVSIYGGKGTGKSVPVDDKLSVSKIKRERDVPLSETRLFHKPLRKREGTVFPVHPWLRAKTLPDNRCDDRCARILVAVDMAKEGLNNPLCTTIAWTHVVHSLIDLIQRIGRALRAVWKLNDVKGLEYIQTVHLMWPDSMEEMGKNIRSAISWIHEMEERGLELGLRTLEGLTMGEIDENAHNPEDPESVLTPDDRLEIERAIGRKLRETDEMREVINCTREYIKEKFSGKETSQVQKREKAEDYADKVAKDPSKSNYFDLSPMPMIEVEIRNDPNDSYSVSSLRDYLLTDGISEYGEVFTNAHLNKPTGEWTQDVISMLKERKERRDKARYAAPVPRFTMFDSKNSEYPGLNDYLYHNYVLPKFNQEESHKFSGEMLIEARKAIASLIREAVGIPPGRKMRNGDEFDVPAYHSALLIPETRNKLAIKALSRMIDKNPKFDPDRVWVGNPYRGDTYEA